MDQGNGRHIRDTTVFRIEKSRLWEVLAGRTSKGLVENCGRKVGAGRKTTYLECFSGGVQKEVYSFGCKGKKGGGIHLLKTENPDCNSV